MQTTSKNIGNS